MISLETDLVKDVKDFFPHVKKGFYKDYHALMRILLLVYGMVHVDTSFLKHLAKYKLSHALPGKTIEESDKKIRNQESRLRKRFEIQRRGANALFKKLSAAIK